MSTAYARLAAAALAVAVLTGGCADVGDETEEQVQEVGTGLFAALDLTEARVPFETEQRTSTACATELGLELGRDEGQAWYVRQASGLRPGQYDDADLLERAVRHLEQDGWDVQRYEGTGAGVRRALTAEKGELAVIVTTPVFDVLVTGGPCSRVLNRLGDRWQPVDS